MTIRIKKIISIVGARPNFMKMASIHRALEKQKSVTHLVVHTGQHFSKEMSEEIFEDLGLPAPDHQLSISGGSGLTQISQAIIALEKLLEAERPNLVLVYGDVNSTVAGALCTSRLGIKLAHVEAGLRSFDRTMPEELNRMMTDSITDLAFVTEPSGKENLLKEGWPRERIHHVGNTMIDSLIHILKKTKPAEKRAHPHLVVTLHRPSNVDSPENLKHLLKTLEELSDSYEIIFPIHPRTKKSMEAAGLEKYLKQLTVVSPLRYSDFISLVKSSSGVVTDSGGIQEETTYLGIPCLTLRENTERPVTITEGTNQLLSPTKPDLAKDILKFLKNPKKHRIPEFWDGHAGERIVEICLKEI